MATKTRNPTGDGTFSGTWTGSAGSRWQSVDDHPDSSGADKLTHGTTAGRSTFTFTAFDVPTGSVVNSVQVLYYDQKTGSQAASWGAFLRVNATDRATNDAHNPANLVWTLRTATYSTNPATSAAWTVDDVNGVGSNPLQGFGTIATDASPTCELASIQLLVDYTPPASGTLTATLDDVTKTLTGTVDVTGTTSATLGALTCSAAGTVVDNSGSSGTLSATLDALTSVGAGAVDVVGQATATLGTLTSSAAGQVDVTGATSATLAGVGATSTGKVDVVGTTTATLAGVGATLAGKVDVVGTTATTLAGIGLVATGVIGSPPVTGTLTATLGGATLAAAGRVDVAGTLGATLADLGATFTGSVDVLGILAVTLNAVTLSAAGQVIGTSGTFSYGKTSSTPRPEHDSTLQPSSHTSSVRRTDR